MCKKFNSVRRNSGMSWKEATQHFLNCFGEITSLQLEKVSQKYQNSHSGSNYYKSSEDGFKLIVTDYIKELCKDDDAKETLKVEILKGYWQKPVDVEINDDSLCVQQLL